MLRCAVLVRYVCKTFVYFLINVCFLTLLIGCRSPSAPERALSQFREAVAKGRGADAWKLLSSSSRRTWNVLAQQFKHKSGKKLFLAGDIWRPTRLRRDPKHRLQISKNRAVLFFRNELEQPVRIELVRESEVWRIVLPVPLSQKAHRTKRPSQ